MILSYKYRVYPNREQEAALCEMLSDFCELYNAALEQRILAYQRNGVALRYINQASELKETRRAHEGLLRWSYSAEQQVLRKLEKTFSDFFGRIRRGAKPGFPRFKGRNRYGAAEYRVGDGLHLKGERLRIRGIPGEMRMVMHRPLPSVTKSAVISRHAGRWHVVLYVEVADVDRGAHSKFSKTVGVDLGITNLVAFSTGERAGHLKINKTEEAERRRRQRALGRCRMGSGRHAKRKAIYAKFRARGGNRRRDFLHKLSLDIVRRFGRVAIEALDVQAIGRTHFAKGAYDAAWAILIAMMRYKAAKAGGEVVEVDPRGTSRTCPGCGAVASKKIWERTHRCSCGCVLDRDVAAAMVIHYRAFGFWPGAGHEALSGPSRAKLVSEAA